MLSRSLGTVEVGAIGLGEMPLSISGRPDEARAIATIHAALDAGVTLIDTADAYCLDEDDFGHGERLVAKALDGRRDGVIVATKGGHTRRGTDWELDGRPEHLAQAARASLRRLGGDAIDLYQHHRPDPDVPYAETLGALRQLLDDGIVRLVGISNADLDQIKQAQEIVGDGFVAVQNQFSPAFRSSEDELRYCAAQGIAFLPWSPLGGISSAGDLGGAFAEVAAQHDASPQQVCLAWMLGKADTVIPIPGSSRPETIRASAAATHVDLSDDERALLDAA